VPDPDSTPVDELRKRAAELDVPGRSKMSGEDLAGAIDIAERKRAEAEVAIDARVSSGADEQRFPVSRLRAVPAILGHSVAAVAAAFADAGVSETDELTRSEVEAMIKRSQERPVQLEEA
jgi:hypothetical protein